MAKTNEAFEKWRRATRVATGCTCTLCHDRDLATWQACEEHHGITDDPPTTRERIEGMTPKELNLRAALDICGCWFDSRDEGKDNRLLHWTEKAKDGRNVPHCVHTSGFLATELWGYTGMVIEAMQERGFNFNCDIDGQTPPCWAKFWKPVTDRGFARTEDLKDAITIAALCAVYNV